MAQRHKARFGLFGLLLGANVARFCRWCDEFGLYGHSYGHHDDRKATSDRTVSDQATENFPRGFIGLGAAVWLVENYEV